MAETKKAKAARPKTKKGKAAPKKKSTSRARRAAPKPAFQRKVTTFNVADLIDHPLVADLLAVGALAAVGAIADHNVKTRTGEAESGSSKAIKAAGKAAAAAVGKRLMTEVDAIKQASKPGRPKDPKRGSK